jgi:rubredoxin
MQAVPMPWKCPACQTTLRHGTEILRPEAIYRCHVCRLELVVDLGTDTLVLAPFPTPEPIPPPKRSA